MSDQTGTYQPPPAKRRRLRFSLRTLLILFTVVSLWFGFVYSRIENERLAAEAVAEASGTVIYDWQIRPAGMDPSVKLKRPWPEWLRQYLGPHWFDQIVEVSLNEDANPSAKNKFTVVGPKLVRLPALRSLTLWNTDVNQETCELLGTLTQIEDLSLRSKTVFEPPHLAAIARAVRLKKLRLNYVRISPEGLKELTTLKDLRELKLSCVSSHPQTGNLLAEDQLDDESARVIATYSSLTTLMLFGTKITNEGIESLSRLERLDTLVIGSQQVTGKALVDVSKLEHLEHLGAWSWEIEGQDLPILARLPRLKSLQFVTDLTDDGMAALSRLKRLERLSVKGEAITEASVPHLMKLRNLVQLNLSRTAIPKHSEAATLLKQSFPGCHVFLPKTEREEELKRQFQNWKWGGFQ